MKTYVFFRHFSATKIHILFKPAILSSKFFSFLYSFLSIRQLNMYKKPSFAHELTECSKKMTKKNVRFHQPFLKFLLFFYRSTSYNNHTPDFTLKILHLSVHYINYISLLINLLQKPSKCKKHLFCELLPKTALFSPYARRIFS